MKMEGHGKQTRTRFLRWERCWNSCSAKEFSRRSRRGSRRRLLRWFCKLKPDKPKTTRIIANCNLFLLNLNHPSKQEQSNRKIRHRARVLRVSALVAGISSEMKIDLESSCLVSLRRPLVGAYNTALELVYHHGLITCYWPIQNAV